jgi:ribosomal protein S18 acetylase RimI-like enzyme
MDEISIKRSQKNDLAQYTELLQKTYQNSYINPEIRLTKDCFSEEIFASSRIQALLKKNLLNNKQQKTWLALLNLKIVGSITILNKNNEYELKGFYVASEYQGKGIGKMLWQKAYQFTKEKDIVLDIFAHNKKTIDMYKKWGFDIDSSKGKFFSHWPEWPKDVVAECIYMRLKKRK